MARLEKNTVDYFPHSVEHGRKMHYIEDKYGNDGYSTWFKLLEELGKTEHHYLDLKDVTTGMYLSSRCKVEEKKLFEIIDDLVRMDEFNKELWDKYRVIWCQKFIDNITDAYKRRSTQCWQLKDLCVHLSTMSGINVDINKVEGSIKPHTILDKTILNKTILDKKKKERDHLFIDSDYYDLEKFVNSIGDKYKVFNLQFYHEAVKNWSDAGGKKKKNWLATARGFMTRDFQNGKPMLKKGISLDEKKSKIEVIKEQGDRIEAKILKEWRNQKNG